MRKLKEKVIDKLIAAKATSAEVDFVVWLSHHQDASGLVRGVYYRDICDDLHILSPQTFYNVKNSLEAKGIIEVCKDDSWHGDWDVRILDNDFSNEDFRPGKIQGSYLNMGLSVFYSREFFGMKANEKLMTMLYIKIAGVGSPNYHIGTALFFQKYTALFGVKERTLRDYLKGIRRFFSIGIKDRKYWISPLRKKVNRESGTTDRAERVKQVAGSLCRRFRLDERLWRDCQPEHSFQRRAPVICFMGCRRYRDDSVSVKVSTQSACLKKVFPAFTKSCHTQTVPKLL